MKAKKYIKRIVIISLLIPLFIEFILIIDTVPVMNTISSNLSGDIPYDVHSPLLDNPNINQNDNFVKPYYKLRRLFTLHNFKRGYVVVYYCTGYYNNEGDIILTGYSLVKYFYERDNFKWKIVDSKQFMGDSWV